MKLMDYLPRPKPERAMLGATRRKRNLWARIRQWASIVKSTKEV